MLEHRLHQRARCAALDSCSWGRQQQRWQQQQHGGVRAAAPRLLLRQSRRHRQPAALLDVDAIVAGLPIREVIGDVVAALDTSSCAVLEAPPGAGKTTAVPLALLAHSPAWLQDQTIMVLEPRRVAAKAAARRMAALLGEPVGRTVGYRVRLESRVSAATRVEVVTEGILLRRLAADPGLAGVGAVILDEFHERSLDADSCLTLSLDCQALVRPDLRLLVMSATLGGGLAEELQVLMAAGGDGSSGSSSSVPVVRSEGRSFPVTTHYCGKPLLQKRGDLEAATTAAVLRALAAPSGQRQQQQGGDVLVFLPGVAEIRRVQGLLHQEAAVRKAGVEVQQLHGSLPPQQQDAVIRPRRGGASSSSDGPPRRRVVLSTPIAESSITIDGVTAVVDSGLARAPRYDPATGISRLVTQVIGLDSAEQRRGRAGRTQPGTCYRLWDPADEERMLATTPPEIASADLAPLALQLAAWGCPDGQGLRWLDAPEPEALSHAQQLLQDLAAVDDRGRLTDTGRRMAAVPAHPRFAHTVLRAQQLGAPELGCLLAATLSERDLFRGTSTSDQRNADLAARLRVLVGGAEAPPGYNAPAAQRVLLSGQQMLQGVLAAADGAAAAAAAGAAGAGSGSGSDSAASTLDELDEAESGDDDDASSSSSSSSSSSRLQARAVNAASFAAAAGAQLQKPGLLGALVAASYADRIAQLKPGSSGKPTYALRSGRSVTLPSASDPLASNQYIAVAELLAGRDGRNDRITLGAGLPAAAISTYLADEVCERTVVFWAAASKAVGAKRQRVLGSLVLSEQAVPVDDAAALPVLMKGLADGGWASLPIPAAAEAWRERAAWLHAAEMAASGASSLPDLSPRALLASLPSWLGPHLAGVRTKAQLQKLPWLDIFKGQLGGWAEQQRVDADAPTHLVLPTGTRVPISYAAAGAGAGVGAGQPKAAVKLQEVLGLADTPLLGGRATQVPLLLELLSPAGRPLQVTTNLASFWAGAYSSVRKEMQGRYPKHVWPADPSTAAPTRLTKKQQAAAAGDGGGGGPALTTTSSKKKKRSGR